MSLGKPQDWAAYDALQTCIALLDDEGQVVTVNAAFEDYLALSRRSAVGQFFGAWLDTPFDDTFCEIVKRPFSKGEKMRLHLSPFFVYLHSLVDRPAQESIPTQPALLLEAVPIQWASQHFELEHAKAQAAQEKDLMRNLAHEIKNPLGGIRGAAQLLQTSVAKLGADSQTVHLTQIVMKEADRLKSLVDQFLVPHRQAVEYEYISIHEVLERVRSVLLAEHPMGLEVVRDYDASLPEIFAHRESLIQAVLNLGRNALQAMQRNLRERRARLVLKTRVLHKVSVQGKGYPMVLEVTMQDNGDGVAPELQKHIFQPLVSGRSDGTGLGLTLSKTIVESHGGALFLRSSQPGATEFCLQLPLQVQRKHT